MPGLPAGVPSKKERVLSLARQDPFLRIEEIAKLVGTTAPYVRTILSEGQVSLSRLRKAYARDMERRLGGEQVEWKADREVFSLHEMDDGAQPNGPLRVERLDAGARAAYGAFGLDENGGPVRATLPLRSHSGISYLFRVVRRGRISEGPLDSSDALGRLRERLGLDPTQDRHGALSVEVECADDLTAEALETPSGAPVLVFRTEVVRSSEVVAVEEYMFRAEDVRLVWHAALQSFGVECKPDEDGRLALGS